MNFISFKVTKNIFEINTNNADAYTYMNLIADRVVPWLQLKMEVSTVNEIKTSMSLLSAMLGAKFVDTLCYSGMNSSTGLLERRINVVLHFEPPVE